jgi:inosine-uridine nucleoside N-ribohydrolase
VSVEGSVAQQRVIIDSDPGIDDAQAILFALLCGRFQVDAITTVFGNCPVDTSAQNALRLVELCGRGDIPVYRGAAEPLVMRRLPADTAAAVHGTNGLGDIDTTRPVGLIRPGYAAAELARRVVEAPGEITVLALGPLTNVALALRLEPRFARSVKRVIYMGGIVRGPGNVTPVATANVLNDPEAAQVVFAAGIEDFTMLGQDVTRKVRISDDRRQRMRDLPGDIAKFIYDITGFYAKAYSTIEADIPGFPVHDLLVMVYALRPDLFETRPTRVDIETEGRFTTGMTVPDFRSFPVPTPNVDVCLEVDGCGALDYYEHVIREGCRREHSARTST